MNLLFDVIEVFIRFFPLFMQGVMVTVGLALITVLMGTLLGSLLALMRLGKIKIFNWLASAYMEIVRGTPLLLQIVFFVYFLPDIIHLDIEKSACVVIALVLNSAAYVSEIIRAGLQAVDKGQYEAAKSLGMSNQNMMVKIIFPQAIKNILPALVNEFASVIKETSLAQVFFLGDIMTVQKTLMTSHFLILEPMIISGLLYFTLTFSLSKIIGVLEARMKQSD